MPNFLDNIKIKREKYRENFGLDMGLQKQATHYQKKPPSYNSPEKKKNVGWLHQVNCNIPSIITQI